MSTSSNEISLILLRHLQPLLPPTNNPRMFRYLDSLWISHVRSLAQVIHDCTFGRDVTQIPIDMMKQLRAGVQTAVSNMARHPSLRVATHQDTDPSAVSEYYVPSFATLTFFMMEWFVNLIGFDGDEDHAMIVRSDYYRVPLDAPGSRLIPWTLMIMAWYRLRAFVHGIMRAATHDFQFLDFLPSYPLAEHRKLCSWVEVLLWHLRLVVKTIDHRPFHMLQLVSFLCHFVGYTNGDDSVESLRPTILLPLIGASSKQIIMTGCRGNIQNTIGTVACSSDVQSSPAGPHAPMGVTGPSSIFSLEDRSVETGAEA
ncbi:hypothetical protein B0H13DRAFT_2318655 [Mycena leptocephala]|nr:hypothetical protein B0H13DRAFT_2318655 [Mycena leptocephala]